jgi:hypothetical protein
VACYEIRLCRHLEIQFFHGLGKPRSNLHKKQNHYPYSQCRTSIRKCFGEKDGTKELEGDLVSSIANLDRIILQHVSIQSDNIHSTETASKYTKFPNINLNDDSERTRTLTIWLGCRSFSSLWKPITQVSQERSGSC